MTEHNTDALACTLCKTTSSCFYIRCKTCCFILCCKCYLTIENCTICNKSLNDGIFFQQRHPDISKHHCVGSLLNSLHPENILNFHIDKRLLESQMVSDHISVAQTIIKLTINRDAVLSTKLFTDLLTLYPQNQDMQAEIGSEISQYLKENKYRIIFQANALKVDFTYKGKNLIKGLLQTTSDPNLQVIFRELEWICELKRGPFVKPHKAISNEGLKHLTAINYFNSFLITLFFLFFFISTATAENIEGTLCSSQENTLYCSSQCRHNTYKQLLIRNPNSTNNDILFKVDRLRLRAYGLGHGRADQIPNFLWGNLDEIFARLSNGKSALSFLAQIDTKQTFFQSQFFKLNKNYGFYRHNNQFFVQAPYLEIPLYLDTMIMASFRLQDNTQLDAFFIEYKKLNLTYPCHFLQQKRQNHTILTTDVPNRVKLNNISIFNFYNSTVIIRTNDTGKMKFYLKDGYFNKPFECNSKAAVILPPLFKVDFHQKRLKDCILTIEDNRFYFQRIQRKCMYDILNCHEITNNHLYLFFIIFPLMILLGYGNRVNIHDF